MRGFNQSPMYLLQHPLRFSQYLIVPETQYPISHRGKLYRAVRIIASLFVMLTTVRLHNQFRFDTSEIDDIWFDNHLASKLVPCLLATAQVAP